MPRRGGKKPVIIIVDGERHILQVPCTYCHGGESLVYSPMTSTHIGTCQQCTDGLADTPLYAAIKKHMGIFDELRGSWMARAVFTSPIFPNLPRITGVDGAEHFYPADWHNRAQYDHGLCTQGLHRERGHLTPTEGRFLSNAGKRCKNCERIKKAREQGDPVVYG